MKKYIKPEIKCKDIEAAASMLAASDPDTITFPIGGGGEATEGPADAKDGAWVTPHSVWDD